MFTTFFHVCELKAESLSAKLSQRVYIASNFYNSGLTCVYKFSLCASKNFNVYFLRYHWLPETEWWRLYGDARNYGKKKTVLVGIGNLNHEQMLHNVQYQSPKEFYPISVFYYGDDR